MSKKNGGIMIDDDKIKDIVRHQIEEVLREGIVFCNISGRILNDYDQYESSYISYLIENYYTCKQLRTVLRLAKRQAKKLEDKLLEGIDVDKAQTNN